MSNQARIDYRIRLGATIDCARFLLQQGLPFCGHDETEDSKNQGNFLELLQWLCNHNKDIEVVSLKNAPENLKLTAPDIQKDIVNCIAVEIVNSIIQDIGDKLFSILIDESKDISSKEQMSTSISFAKRRDMLREKHSANTFEALNNGELSSGRGLNQETMIKRPGDTRWGSHYITLVRCISMFSSICEVLEIIIDDGSNFEQKYEAKVLIEFNLII
ncbi:hypothetical protein IC582_014535 [Cucumis melo]